eukprot:340518-Rhodomonas_salina.4
MFEQAKADPAHRLYNVFMPLVDLSEASSSSRVMRCPGLNSHTPRARMATAQSSGLLRASKKARAR